MYKELHYYFNGIAFNKLIYDAGYDGIKDFVERSGIAISCKTIRRACNDGHCTKRTYYAVACKLAETLGWEDPIAELKTAFTTKPKHEEECHKNHYEELLKNAAVKHEKECDKKLEQCIVYLTDGREALIQGKSIYWSWFISDNTICFYDEKSEHGEGDGDLKIAEFNKACIMGIVRVIEE